jgi:DNA-binding transcriptional LysR family regulator
MAKTSRRIDSNAARVFVAIVEEGSIAKAAQREHIVPSAVSKRLAELESMLGVSLVERGQFGVKPTAAGEALLHHARMVLATLDRLHDDLSEYVEGVRGHIRVRTSASALLSGLPEDIESFLKTHKRVKIDLEELETPVIVREVLDGKADVGIGPNLFSDESLQTFPYRRYDLAAAVPADHPLAGSETIGYLETLKYEQVEQSAGGALSQLLDYVARQSSVTKRTRIRVRGFEAVARMIGSGMGIGVLPSFMEPNSRMFGLKFIPLTDDWAHPLICVMTRDLQALPSAARAFVDHLRNASTEP